MTKYRPHDDPYRPDDIPPPEPAPPAEDAPGCLPHPNLITGAFVLLTLLFVAYFALLMVNPYVPLNPFPPRTPLPVILVATADPNQPTATPTATKPPDSPSLSTLAPTMTFTPFRPTLTPLALSPSATGAPADVPPTTTPPPTATTTPTLIGGTVGTSGAAVFTPPPPPDPAEITRSPLAFTVDGDAVVYVENPNAGGCLWSSIAGTVVALTGRPVAGLGVQLSGEGRDEIQFTGTAPLYGEAGYEFFLGDAPQRATYTVQLLSQTGAPISEPFAVTTSPDCDSNVALVNFIQNHAF